MAMVVQHNAAAQLALGELNKNVNKVGDLLAKVSSGQKLNSAKDDAASFCISEKMREQIRTLLQDNQNVQNGSSLFKIAEGGINNIVEELRNLKELAINAANDTNTDQDRAIIQKEFDQRRANIDDIATATNYNGKTLIDGTYKRPDTETVDAVLSYIYKTYDYILDDAGNVSDVITTTGVGGSVDDSNVFTNGITGLFNLDEVTARGKTSPSVSWVNDKIVYGDSTTGGRSGYRAYNWLEFDFSGIARRDGGTLNIPNDLHKQGFSVFCSDYSGCPAFHGFVFDSTKALGTGEKTFNTSGPVYVIGIAGITSSLNDLSDELSAAIFSGVKDAISNAQGAREYVNNTGNSEIIHLSGYGDEVELKCETNTDGTVTYSMMQHYNMWIYQGYDTGAVYPSGLPPTGPGGSIVDDSYVADVEELNSKYQSLVIHHGPRANQATRFFLEDMHTKSLKGKKLTQEDLEAVVNLDGDREKQEALLNVYVEAMRKTLDQASVETRRDANVAIRIVDGALSYALSEATYVGSYLQRLEYTGANVTTMGENVQSSESVIRDADMAKEMTEYTKYNVLTQSAQAMLAQANQNSSSVLSLLQ